MAEKTLIMAWDCTCGNKKILGIATYCPVCQTERPANVKFYLPDDAEEITDTEELKVLNSGPDWECGVCSAINKDSSDKCFVCKEDKANGKPLQVKTYENGDVPRTGDNNTNYQHNTEVQQPKPNHKPKQKSQTSEDYSYKRANYPNNDYTSKSTNRSDFGDRYPNPTTKTFFWVAGLILLFIWMTNYFFFTTEDLEVKATGTTWTRTIQMEQLKTFTDSSWADEVPTGARQISSWSEVRSTIPIYDDHYPEEYMDKEEDGYEEKPCGKIVVDNGNGTATEKDKMCKEKKYKDVKKIRYIKKKIEDRPVNDTKIKYEIDRWVNSNVFNSSGSTSELYWPQVTIRTFVVNG